MNLICGLNEISRLFWHEQVLSNIKSRFGFIGLTEEEKINLYECSSPFLMRIVLHLLKMSSCSLTTVCLNDIQLQIFSQK